MVSDRRGEVSVPSFREVLRAPVFLPVFLASTLSTWGDYIARITVAAVVFSWTGSALATAATFAVSLVPSILGRALLSPLCDRLAPRTCLVGTHLIRAVLVGCLVAAVTATRSVALVLVLLFVLEFVGGPAITASQILLTDLFPDRRLYARAFGLTTLATQVNQAIGLALGGVIVGRTGDVNALALDLATFLIGAAVLWMVAPRRSEVPPEEQKLAGLVGDLAQGWREIRRSRVLTILLVVSLASALAIAAPEAVALPYASGHNGSPTWGGFLMAAPILGTVVGLILIGRRPAEHQTQLVMRLALLTPLPLLVTIVEPPLTSVWAAWFVCGALQAYMLPLQSAFTLLVPLAMRGRVFGLAGALSVGVTGLCFLLAGWISERTSPAASVGVCAVISLGVLVLLAARWPREEISAALEATFDPEVEGTPPPSTRQPEDGIPRPMTRPGGLSGG
ncbi:MFS transporter [Pedococcus sp. 5OH_020]|uniref:MFS transporter n=1 Tax=Pedococcus sp. 5OH_020 TaxID=2989814 RepID=UPI0022E9C7DE|nr:MFS transporter [Pedococcus sp. 5OH_020]